MLTVIWRKTVHIIRANVSPILDVVDLKWYLIAAWLGLQQHVIDKAINQWCGRCVPVWELMDNT